MFGEALQCPQYSKSSVSYKDPCAIVSDDELGRLATDSRLRSTQSIGRSSATSSIEGNRMDLAIKAMKLSCIIHVLSGIKEEVKRNSEAGPGRDGATLIYLANSE